jgi:hypothetical protein
MRASYLLSFAVVLSVCTVGACQTTSEDKPSGFLDKWFERVSRTQAEQPHWLAPLFTATPRLEEMYVYDTSWQSTVKGNLTNFGGGKGMLLIPTEHINIVMSSPPFMAHENPRIHDGFGDTGFSMRYRFLAENEDGGNYIVTGILGATLPTGSYTNGTTNAVLTPSIAIGKGWGDFDIQSTLGVGIPIGNANKLGTPVLYNAAFQYRVLKKFWPEVEVNTTIFPNGPRAGNKQLFISPGLIVGKFHLWRRLSFGVGGGIQIAATHYHTFNHNRVLTLRFPF